MELTHEALLVQKNAGELINELLFTLQEIGPTEGYRTDGDSLSDLVHDRDVWDVSKWGGDERSMNEDRLKVEILWRLFDMSEMIENNRFRNDMATRNVERQLPDLESKERLNDIDDLLKELKNYDKRN